MISLLLAIYLLLVSTPGRASWYGGGEKLNRLTTSEEPFDPARLTCALRSREFGGVYLVTCLDTGCSVIVRHNDYGPGRGDRAIDLSRAAFAQIADLDEGVTTVSILKLRGAR